MRGDGNKCGGYLGVLDICIRIGRFRTCSRHHRLPGTLRTVEAVEVVADLW
jgi:hypothetical protein